ncbi:aminotransferase class V-fold PLP-dependent enzyme [bacterium]|nr:MAG: aminotransferase class V-fold PLP-dependent enzyme [bacterium]
MAFGKKEWFMIDHEPTYLAHGSFGGCLSVAYEDRLSWYEKLEKNPHNFLVNELFDELKESRKALANYLNCNFNNLVYFPNPSTALNTVIRSLDLNENDEVLTSNHEYGALDKTWNFYSEKRGFKYKKVKIGLPYDEEDFFIESFKKSITKKTKVIFLSHITSSTALIFPVEKICKIAKDNNILIIIDGAHAPAQTKLDLKKLDADIYVGACHKWMCAPKGVSFLYAKESLKDSIEPLVVSWGWRDEMLNEKSKYINNHQWQGTNDLSAYLTIPKVIRFLNQNKWNHISNECRNLILYVKNRFKIDKSLCIPTSNNDKHLGQMLSFQVNQNSKFSTIVKQDQSKIVQLQKTIYKKSNIHIPIIYWNGSVFMRVSIQAYNSESDINKMFDMLEYFNLL